MMPLRTDTVFVECGGQNIEGVKILISVYKLQIIDMRTGSHDHV